VGFGSRLRVYEKCSAISMPEFPRHLKLDRGIGLDSARELGSLFGKFMWKSSGLSPVARLWR